MVRSTFKLYGPRRKLAGAHIPFDQPFARNQFSRIQLNGLPCSVNDYQGLVPCAYHPSPVVTRVAGGLAVVNPVQGSAVVAVAL